MRRDVVVLVPGIMGSVLFRADATSAWPPSVGEIITGLPDKRFQEILRADLKPHGVIDAIGPVDVYGSFVDYLHDLGFPPRASADTSGSCSEVFAYDWRRDLAVTAKDGLVPLLDAIAHETPKNIELKIHLVAHSMGGLLCRHVLESGSYALDQHAGVAAVRALITAGTPHLGAPQALLAARGLLRMRELGLSADQVRAFARNSGTPTLYQLLPPPGIAFASFVSDATLPDVEPMGACDIYRWRRELDLAEDNLESALAFRKTLGSGPPSDRVGYYCFSGTREVTTAQIRIRRGATPWQIDQIDETDGGDNTVPVWSSSLPLPHPGKDGLVWGSQVMAIGGTHRALVSDGDFRGALARLVAQERLSTLSIEDRATVSLGGEAFTPESAVEAKVQVLPVRLGVNVELGLEPMAGGPASSSVSLTTSERGRAIANIRAPKKPGGYRAVVRKGDRVLGSQGFFVVEDHARYR